MLVFQREKKNEKDNLHDILSCLDGTVIWFDIRGWGDIFVFYQTFIQAKIQARWCGRCPFWPFTEFLCDTVNQKYWQVPSLGGPPTLENETSQHLSRQNHAIIFGYFVLLIDQWPGAKIPLMICSKLGFRLVLGFALLVSGNIRGKSVLERAAKLNVFQNCSFFEG